MNYHIGVFGGFKNATSTLQKSFNCRKYHDLPFLIDQNEFNKLDIIVIPFRKNEHVYPSALFQDITIPIYGYSPFSKGRFLDKFINYKEEDKKNIILTTSVDKLYEHYKNINWDDLIQLNNKMRLYQINNHYKINLKYFSNDIQVIYTTINSRKRKIVCFNCDLLNNNFNEIKINIFGANNNMSLIQSNLGLSKWYKNKYEEFINFLKDKKIY